MLLACMFQPRIYMQPIELHAELVRAGIFLRFLGL